MTQDDEVELVELKGVGDKTAEKLDEAGYDDLMSIETMTLNEVKETLEDTEPFRAVLEGEGVRTVIEGKELRQNLSEKLTDFFPSDSKVGYEVYGKGLDRMHYVDSEDADVQLKMREVTIY